MNKVECYNCGKKVSYEIRDEKLEIFKGVRIDIIEKKAYCLDCGEEVDVEDLRISNNHRIGKKYREIKNIPEPFEIEDFRIKYYLSPGEMASLIGLDRKRFIHIENGGFVSAKAEEKLKFLLGGYEQRKEVVTEAFLSGKIGRRTLEKLVNVENGLYTGEDFRAENEVYKMVSKEYEIRRVGVLGPGVRHGYKDFEFVPLENLIGF